MQHLITSHGYGMGGCYTILRSMVLEWGGGLKGHVNGHGFGRWVQHHIIGHGFGRGGCNTLILVMASEWRIATPL